MSTNNNVFKTTSLAVGDTATIVLTDVKDGQYGPIYVGTVNGTTSEIRPSGNLKKLFEGSEMGKALKVTRIPDVKTAKGFNVTQYTVANGEQASTNTISDKLAAIRAKRA